MRLRNLKKTGVKKMISHYGRMIRVNTRRISLQKVHG